MELALSLGNTPKPFSFLDKSARIIGTDLGFCMAVGGQNNGTSTETGSDQRRTSSDPPVQLDLLPFSPVVHRSQPPSIKFPFSWLTKNLVGEKENRGRVEKSEEGPSSLSSPNSEISSFQMEVSVSESAINKRSFEQFTANNNGEGEADRGRSSRGSDEEENGLARKKLRLSKEQSAFLEGTFKEHNTLNPKDKLAISKQLNLSPRQVEVWFQNRRARTKLKQTEVDCEYLKRCCETLTEENRRLQKEVQELRALMASKPFYMQLPATTLTICPSCEGVSAAPTTTATTTAAASSTTMAPTATYVTAVSNKPNNLFLTFN